MRNLCGGEKFLRKIWKNFSKILRRLGLGAVCLLVLGACDMPGTHFENVPATRVTVDGSIFDIRVRGRLAEAVRSNPQYAPRLGAIRSRAAFAMAKVSGCKVREVRGDPALLTGILACKGQPVPRALPPMPLSYSCLELAGWVRDGEGSPYVDYECTPY